MSSCSHRLRDNEDVSAVPFFELVTVDGDAVSYSTIWQRRSLVLVTLPPLRAADDPIAARFLDRRQDFAAHDAALVVTCDPVPGLPAPGILVADRWGEIAHVAAAQDAADLPPVSDALEWLEYLQRRCPECEGEAK
jgi:hypothetical protein